MSERIMTSSRRFLHDIGQKSMPVIELQNVVKTYPAPEGFFRALDGIDLQIYCGEFLGITGKSGAGKTTLLNMISGVGELTTGQVLFRDPASQALFTEVEPVSIHTMDADSQASWRGRNLGIIYQSFELMPTLNLLENVMLPQDFSGHYQPVVSTERALELLDLVEIADHAYKIPAHISGGQKQRVAIARALVNDPAVLIADEPTGNLDTVTAERIFTIFERLVEQGKTIIMVTHDESLKGRFSRHLRIADGRLVLNTVDQVQGRDHRKVASPMRIVSSADPFGGQSAMKSKAILNSSESPSTITVTQKAESIPAISLQSLTKTYENAAGKFTALKDIDLQFDYGQFVSIVGKSGCGKSTLLNMITGIDHPSTGKVIVGGKDLYKMTESQRAAWRGQNMGVVFQFFQLLPTLTVLENTILPMDYNNIYSFKERPERALKLLEMVGLETHAHALPANLSNGQQQSAAIARALATDPPIILADEPTGNLDSRSAEVILNLFETLAAQGKTILIVTHDPSLARRTDRTIILSDGEVVDQTVARALPFLDHHLMLLASRETKKEIFPPGSMVVHQGNPIDQFFMVASGSVDVVVNSKIPETTIARLGPGQFFGEVSLTLGVNAINSVRTASDGPVELVSIPRKFFEDLMKSSPRMMDALVQVAHMRMAETKNLINSYR